MKKTCIASLLLMLMAMFTTQSLRADNRVAALKAARALALRNLVETFYGTKLRFIDEADGADASQYFSITMTKSGRLTLRGVEYIEKYDPSTGIAQVTAELPLIKMADIIDPARFDLKKNPDMVIRRTAFAAATPQAAGKVAAFRAAEIDAYKKLYKLICGFKLSSETKVKNSMLISDKVKTSVTGALLGAKIYGIGWEGEGKDAIAVVKLRLDKKELEHALGSKIVGGEEEYIDAKGRAAAGIRKSFGGNRRKPARSMLKIEPVTDDDSDDFIP